MELLAPAGNEENFLVALESGADAVYIGAPRFNARSLARDLGIDEIVAMIRYAQDQGKKVYVALNSLVRETDLPELLRLLVRLDADPPDGLIVQDLGVARIVRDFFPHLRLHASTLMTAHNRESLRTYAALGFSQVVAARELTLSELSNMTADGSVGIEVFVHGAMCFSYSGLCMFSSYFGGKSGLRGKCVQPCRRKFSSGGGRGKHGRSKSGYLFSMNDLSGLEFVPELKRNGVVSLKIEGRLRSATYVENVVKGYRLVMDAVPDSFDSALRDATELIENAMGRKSTTGYFLTPQPKDALSVHHSGNIGIHLGRITAIKNKDSGLYGALILKKPCEAGDRLRVHHEKSGERISFTLTQMFFQDAQVEQASPAQKVEILLPESSRSAARGGNIEVYLVDIKARTGASRRSKPKIPKLARSGGRPKENNRKFRELERSILAEPRHSFQKQKSTSQPRPRSRKESAEIWLRYDSVKLILERLPFSPDRHVINLNKQVMPLIGRIKNHLKRGARSVIWALPPVVQDAQLSELRKQVRVLIKSGFRSFQIGHLSQVSLFGREKVYLYGDYSLNLLNHQALDVSTSMGLKGLQLCMEADRKTLNEVIDGFRQRSTARGTMLGLTVFGSPPLFTSRLAADHFTYGKTIISPKNESFVIEKRAGYTQTRPTKPFSLLPYRSELESMGLDYLVVDLSGMKTSRKEMEEVAKRISRSPKISRLSTFNYLGNLE